MFMKKLSRSLGRNHFIVTVLTSSARRDQEATPYRLPRSTFHPFFALTRLDSTLPKSAHYRNTAQDLRLSPSYVSFTAINFAC
jgi:hypothetical protein